MAADRVHCRLSARTNMMATEWMRQVCRHCHRGEVGEGLVEEADRDTIHWLRGTRRPELTWWVEAPPKLRCCCNTVKVKSRPIQSAHTAQQVERQDSRPSTRPSTGAC